jgi:hypothetical protein
LDFSAPVLWRMVNRRPDPLLLNGHASFTRVRAASHVLPTETHCTAALEVMSRLNGVLNTMKGVSPIEEFILEGERESFRKFTLQVGDAPGEFLSTNTSANLAVLPDDFLSVLQRLLARYPDKSEVLVPPIKTPLLTNAGSPFYNPGIAAQMASAACWLGDFNKSLDFTAMIHERLGAPPVTALAYGFNTRFGPTDKPWQMWQQDDLGNWYWQDQVSGAFPRRRHVYMGSKTGILATEALARVLKTGRMLLPGLYHDSARAEVYLRAFWAHGGVKAESDISAFDQSVLAYLQDAVEAALLKRYGHDSELAAGVRAWRKLEALGVIYPGYNPDILRSGTYVSVNGGTKSGHLLTAEIGTIIAMAGMLTAIERMTGRDAVDQWLSGEVIVIDQGDDQLISVPGLDASVVEQTFRDIGLKVKVVKGLRFLSKHLLPTGPTTIGGRYLQQSLSNEWEPTGRHAVPLLALGMEARGTPHPMIKPLVDEGMKVSAMYETHGIYDAITAGEYLRTQEGRAALQRALDAKADVAYAAQLYRDAPFSASAAAMLETLIRLNPNSIENSVSLMNAGWRVIRMMHIMNESERLYYIMKIGEMLAGGIHTAAEIDNYALTALGI